MLYCESVLMRRGRFASSVVSRTRTIACGESIERRGQRVFKSDIRRTILEKSSPDIRARESTHNQLRTVVRLHARASLRQIPAVPSMSVTSRKSAEIGARAPARTAHRCIPTTPRRRRPSRRSRSPCMRRRNTRSAMSTRPRQVAQRGPAAASSGSTRPALAPRPLSASAAVGRLSRER